MPEDLPDRMPEDMPEHMPEDMPGRMPEDMPDRMPEDVPEHIADSSFRHEHWGDSDQSFDPCFQQSLPWNYGKGDHSISEDFQPGNLANHGQRANPPTSGQGPWFHIFVGQFLFPRPLHNM